MRGLWWDGPSDNEHCYESDRNWYKTDAKVPEVTNPIIFRAFSRYTVLGP